MCMFVCYRYLYYLYIVCYWLIDVYCILFIVVALVVYLLFMFFVFARRVGSWARGGGWIRTCVRRYGCMYGCVDVWMYGCMDVGM